MRRVSLSHVSVCDNHLEGLCTLAGAVWGKWAHGMPLLLLLWDGALHGSPGAAGAAAREVLQVRWLMHDRWGLTTGGGAGSVPGLDPGLSFTEKEPPCLWPEQSHGSATPVRPRPGPAPLPAAGTWPSVLCPGCSGLGKRPEACVHKGERREQGLQARPPQVPSCRSGVPSSGPAQRPAVSPLCGAQRVAGVSGASLHLHVGCPAFLVPALPIACPFTSLCVFSPVTRFSLCMD